MKLVTTSHLRLRTWTPAVFGMLALGLMNVALQPCARAEIVVADSTQASIVHDVHHADPARGMTCELRFPCSLCAAHEGPTCDGPPDEDCAVADGCDGRADARD